MDINKLLPDGLELIEIHPYAYKIDLSKYGYKDVRYAIKLNELDINTIIHDINDVVMNEISNLWTLDTIPSIPPWSDVSLKMHYDNKHGILEYKGAKRYIYLSTEWRFANSGSHYIFGEIEAGNKPLILNELRLVTNSDAMSCSIKSDGTVTIIDPKVGTKPTRNTATKLITHTSRMIEFEQYSLFGTNAVAMGVKVYLNEQNEMIVKEFDPKDKDIWKKYAKRDFCKNPYNVPIHHVLDLFGSMTQPLYEGTNVYICADKRPYAKLANKWICVEEPYIHEVFDLETITEIEFAMNIIDGKNYHADKI